MTVINQLPATGIEINVVEGDTFTLPLDLDINLTGYTIEFSCPGVTTSMSNTLSTGLINVTFTLAGLNGSYPWFLRWTSGGGAVRTVLTGVLVVANV